MQKWLEIILTTNRDFLPHLVQLLMSTKIKTWAEEEENGVVRLKVYIPYFDGIENYLSNLRKLLDIEHVDIVTKAIEDEDWAYSWQKFFEVIRVGERIVIKPPWKEYELREGDIILEIEPRMAFGSGYHPTTTNTLILMEKYIKPGMSILDMGCGSGILTITSAHLGASSITGADYDEICTRESNENYEDALARNPEITNQYEFILSDGFKDITGEYDIVLLNISTDFILTNIENINRSLKSGGLFISGSVGGTKLDMITESFRNTGMKIIETLEREGWIGIVAKKG